jgi:hypothetical protein
VSFLSGQTYGLLRVYVDGYCADIPYRTWYKRTRWAGSVTFLIVKHTNCSWGAWGMWVDAEKWVKAERIRLLWGGINPQRLAREETGPCKPGELFKPALSWSTKITSKVQSEVYIGTRLSSSSSGS